MVRDHGNLIDRHTIMARRFVIEEFVFFDRGVVLICSWTILVLFSALENTKVLDG